MHGVPNQMFLRHLLAEVGESRREAARRAGVGRSTMYRWLEAGLLDEPLETLQVRYGPRPERPSKLAPSCPLITARLAGFPPALQATGARLFAPALGPLLRCAASLRATIGSPAGACSPIWSASASRSTTAFGCAFAVPIAPRPKAKSSGRSATCAALGRNSTTAPVGRPVRGDSAPGAPP